MIRIRGIYSTAVTRVLSDMGYPFSDVTDVIKGRFKGEIKVVDRPPAITIKDRDDLKGIIILGDPDLVGRIAFSLVAAVPGAIGSYEREGPYTSYLVKVVKRLGEKYVVEMPGGREGVLSTHKDLKPGVLVRAHVVRASSKPILREGAALVGSYVRLVEGGKHGVSRHIRDEDKALELLQLAFRNTSSRWGVRFRSSAAHASLLDVAAEIQELIRKADELLKVSAVEPMLLSIGEGIADIFFTPTSCRYLDGIRGRQLLTMPFHHQLKSLVSGGFSDKVDFTEKILGSTICFNKKQIREIYFDAGLSQRVITVHHMKLLGGSFVWIASPRTEGENIVLTRQISREGVYDGLDVPKEKGDRIISYTRIGARHVVHEYRSHTGEIKGIYVNINTPVGVYDIGELWYVDLEIDIVARPGEKPRVIDEERFDRLAGLAAIQPALWKTYETYVKRALKIVEENGMDGRLVSATLFEEEESLWRDTVQERGDVGEPLCNANSGSSQ